MNSYLKNTLIVLSILLIVIVVHVADKKHYTGGAGSPPAATRWEMVSTSGGPMPKGTFWAPDQSGNPTRGKWYLKLQSEKEAKTFDTLESMNEELSKNGLALKPHQGLFGEMWDSIVNELF